MTPIDPSENGILLRTYRIRVALFLVGVIAALMVLSAVYQGIHTINRLDAVESERDQWQQPAQVLRALNLQEGNTVVDLGCGAGYFALRLSVAVGNRGRVIAVDIRKVPLLFLWIRALLRDQHNITVVHGEADNPRIPAGAVDAVLVANTFHEFSNGKAMLDRTFRSLTPGARLVVVDRGPQAMNIQNDEGGGHHHLPAATVQDELLQSGFVIVSREDHFIDRPGEAWWLIVARRPQQREFRPADRKGKR